MSENENNQPSITFRVETPAKEVASPEVVVEPEIETASVEVEPKETPEKEPETPSKAPEPVQTPIVDAMNKMTAPKQSKMPVVMGFVFAIALGLGYMAYTNTLQPYISEVSDFMTKKKELEDFTKKTKDTIQKTKDKLKTSTKEPIVKSPAVQEARDYYLRLRNEDETISVRTGGSLSWRTGNECLLIWGKFVKDRGAIGKADRFGVWLNPDHGRKACYELLFESNHGYKEKTVADAIRRFAPLREGFKTDVYLKAIRQAKINDGKKMSDLKEVERQRLIDTLIQVEGYAKGKVMMYSSDEDFKNRGY